MLENSDFYESLYLAAVDPIVILERDFVIPQMSSVTLREMPTLAIHASTRCSAEQHRWHREPSSHVIGILGEVIPV